jgi:hypothetical protein
MSDHEFENYLTLISRFLRLSPAQREAIGEELRDHFDRDSPDGLNLTRIQSHNGRDYNTAPPRG